MEGCREGSLLDDNFIFQKEYSVKGMYITFAFVVALQGCATIKRHTGFDVSPAAPLEFKQPWQGGTLCFDPREQHTLVAYPIAVGNSEWRDEQVYCFADGGVVPVETWEVLTLLADGRTHVSCSALNERGNRIFGLFPQLVEKDLDGAHLYLVSPFLDALLTGNGQMVRLREGQWETIKANPSLLRERYPSPMNQENLVTFFYEDKIGRDFIDDLTMRFANVRIGPDGRIHAFSKTGEVLTPLSPQKHFADRYLQRGTLGVSVVSPCLECMGIKAGWDLVQTWRNDPHRSCVKHAGKVRKELGKELRRK